MRSFVLASSINKNDVLCKLVATESFLKLEGTEKKLCLPCITDLINKDQVTCPCKLFPIGKINCFCGLFPVHLISVGKMSSGIVGLRLTLKTRWW